jgi:hypothetical protein
LRSLGFPLLQPQGRHADSAIDPQSRGDCERQDASVSVSR